MLFDFTYNQLKNSSKGIYKEKGSKFISYAFIVKSEKEANKYLNLVKKLEKNARHFCYAYVIYPDKSVIKSNDNRKKIHTEKKKSTQIARYTLPKNKQWEISQEPTLSPAYRQQIAGYIQQ